MGKSTSTPGKEVVAGGGASFNSTGDLKAKGWQKINENKKKSGMNLSFEEQFPKQEVF